MNKYELFDVDDFVSDEYFIDWVLNPQPAHVAFWTDWQSRYPQHQAKLDSAKRVISALAVRPLTEELSAEETDQLLANVQRSIAPKSNHPSYFWTNIKIWAAAAVIVIAISCFWFYNGTKHRVPINEQPIATSGLNEYDNTSNESRIVRFTDGSLAILKPKSKVKYPTTFEGKTRTVYLEGEAFFEVQKDASKPFLVYSQDMITQVVGTSFTVSAFGGASEFKVIVNTGKVKVYRNNQAEKSPQIITLVPHQQAIYKRRTTSIQKDTVQSKLLLTAEMANQSFTLDRVSLKEVIMKLEEAYGVQINYDKEQLGQLTLTAQLANLPLDQKVELVCKAINATCKFSNGEIYIDRNTKTNQTNN
jgi:transmembrane sensor